VAFAGLCATFLTAANIAGMLASERTMTLRIPKGISDFRELREGNFEFVDKSHLITQFLDRDGDKVVLLPRPRRFGKTINVTMLRWFFEKRDENLWHLFEDLHVARAGEQYRAHFQKYPVIFISFKGTKADTWDACRLKICGLVREMFKTHQESLAGRLDEYDQAEFTAVLGGTAHDVQYQQALYSLTKYLHQVHGKRPIVLIDEYDAPIHAGYSNGYYDKVTSFCRSFYEAGLKDNQYLERAVMTGILRVARESIFSGLNNLGVFSLLAFEFNTCFGFTEPEVLALLHKAGIPEVMDLLRSFYNGYDFGGVAIYNPWSILEFLSRNPKQLLNYWVNTSDNALIKYLLQRHAFAVEKDIQTLLEGGSIEKKLDENIVFSDLETSPRSLWNLLVFSGYLKAARPGPVYMMAAPEYLLSIPNSEVDHVYRTTFQSWMDKGLNPGGGNIEALTTALLEGNTKKLQRQLEPLCAYVLSYHDVGGNEPERFYHGLMIGLLAMLEPDYEVRSNRESGTGRPDVMIKPRRPGKPGVILELKAAGEDEGRTLAQALNQGLRQVQKNDYAAELRAAGVETIHTMVIAFDGKQVMVEPGAKKTTKKPTKKTTNKPAALRNVGAAVNVKKKAVKKAVKGTKGRG